ncbi:MAG TPA: tetratricopeptide repeat protein [Chryseosolibacter sp.]|nr:tetratricopeptide repeat protein [Chryseosolibacter sp.]
MAKKVEHKHELVENPQALAEKLHGAETWMERHPKATISVLVAIVLIVGGYFGFQYYKDNQEAEAQREMFQAVYYFEADSLDLALNGDGNNLGFLDIVDEYGITDAADLANYYAGAAFLKQGKFEVARMYLEDFKSNDLLIQARAYSLIGDSYMEEGAFEDAARFYDKAANYKPNKYFSPRYLMKAALAFEKNNEEEKAIAAYDKIINEYFDTPEVQEAKKFKAKLETAS